MPRHARVIIPGVPHHIVQRGNNRRQVFFESRDFDRYSSWYNQYAERYNISTLAYCLMPNHVHFVVIPQDREGLSRLCNTAHMRYAQYIHAKHESSGHLWQGRYFSEVMTETHLYRAMRYVEQNPVRAGMVRQPWEYKWSSAKWHTGASRKQSIKLSPRKEIDAIWWKEFLKY